MTRLQAFSVVVQLKLLAVEVRTAQFGIRQLSLLCYVQEPSSGADESVSDRAIHDLSVRIVQYGQRPVLLGPDDRERADSHQLRRLSCDSSLAQCKLEGISYVVERTADKVFYACFTGVQWCKHATKQPCIHTEGAFLCTEQSASGTSFAGSVLPYRRACKLLRQTACGVAFLLPALQA